MADEKLIKAVARRLNGIMIETGMETAKELADRVGAQRSQASNWLNEYALAPVPFMITLVKKYRLTLDWIYMGDPAGLEPEIAIRLMAIDEKMPPPRLEPAAIRLALKDASYEAAARPAKKLSASASAGKSARKSVPPKVNPNTKMKAKPVRSRV